MASTDVLVPSHTRRFRTFLYGPGEELQQSPLIQQWPIQQQPLAAYPSAYSQQFTAINTQPMQQIPVVQQQQQQQQQMPQQLVAQQTPVVASQHHQLAGCVERNHVGPLELATRIFSHKLRAVLRGHGFAMTCPGALRRAVSFQSCASDVRQCDLCFLQNSCAILLRCAHCTLHCGERLGHGYTATSEGWQCQQL